MGWGGVGVGGDKRKKVAHHERKMGSTVADDSDYCFFGSDSDSHLIMTADYHGHFTD